MDLNLLLKMKKSCFSDILKSVIGDKIKPDLMQDIYANIHEISEQSEDGETPILGVIDIKNILNNCGAGNYMRYRNCF